MLFTVLLANAIMEGGHQFVQKYLANRFPAAIVTMGMFGTSAILAFFYHIFLRHGIVLSPTWPIIALAAAANALAAWFFVQAVKINLTRSSLVVPYVNIVSVLLIAIFLKEWRLFSISDTRGLLLLLGTLFASLATALFALKPDNRHERNPRWFKSAIPAIGLWGLVHFAMKYISLDSVPTDNFLVAWYPAALLTSGAIHLVQCQKQKNSNNQNNGSACMAQPRQAGRRQVYILALLFICLGLLTVGTLGLFYFALTLGPGVLVFSVHDILQVTTGTLIGLFIFGEKKKFNRREALGLAIGAAAAVSLILSSALGT